MEGEPLRQQHDFDRDERHCAPGHLLEHGEHDAGEDIGAGGTALAQDPLSGQHHVRCIHGIACKLQGVIGLDGTTDVARAPCEEGVAPIFALSCPKIHRDLGLKFGLDFIHEMHHQDVFGRDRAIGFKFEDPIAILVLKTQEVIACAGHRATDRVRRLATKDRLEVGRGF